MKKHITILIIFFLFVLTIMPSCKYNETQSATGRQKQIIALIAIGMNIDEARDALLKEGLKVSEKHFPTKNKDYCQIMIPLISKISASETARYVTGSEPGKTKAYVIVTAKPDGTITEIE